MQDIRPFFRVCLALLLAAGCSMLAACARGGQDLAGVGVELVLNPPPPCVRDTTVGVTLEDEAGQVIEGAQIELEGNMSHAGMQPVLAAASEVAAGQYEARLTFTMNGDWFIVVRATLPDGRALERTFDVPGVDMTCDPAGQ